MFILIISRLTEPLSLQNFKLRFPTQARNLLRDSAQFLAIRKQLRAISRNEIPIGNHSLSLVLFLFCMIEPTNLYVFSLHPSLVDS